MHKEVLCFWCGTDCTGDSGSYGRLLFHVIQEHIEKFIDVLGAVMSGGTDGGH